MKLLTLVILTHISTLSANALNAQKYLYCENKYMQKQKLEIAIDKAQNRDIVNIKHINDSTKNLNRLNAILDRQCKGIL